MCDDRILERALPEAPMPSEGSRSRALAAAMRGFDEKIDAGLKGNAGEVRPMQRKGKPPVRKHGESRMNKTRWAIAASVLVAVGSVPLVRGMLTSSASLDSVTMSKSTGFDGPSQGNSRNTVGQASTEIVGRVPRMLPDWLTPSAPASNLPAPDMTTRSVQGGLAPSRDMATNLRRDDSRRIEDAANQGSRPIPTVQATPPNGSPPAQARQQQDAASPVPPSPMAQNDAQRQAMGLALAEAKRLGTAQLNTPPQALTGIPQADSYAGPSEPQGRDAFAGAEESPYKVVREQPVSTFSLDVDTASYSFVRASLARNMLPQKAAVRTEEMVNYFPYAYPASTDPKEPFKATVTVMPSPWNEGRKLVHIGIKGYEVKAEERPKANLVFLVDTSGSMMPANRLPLAKQALSMLVGQLDGRDSVAIVAYAGSAGTVLEPTPASDKRKILAAIESLGAGGGTAGAEGIRQAYALAEANYDPKAVNRVMLATDGDFNVGITNREELKGFVERKRDTGIFLSVLGFGMGNYNDAMMQSLAQNGNGVAAYIDTLAEARKTLVEEATSSIIPIARDVKVQFEFNPAQVSEYRLVGYETRALRREDFNNDKVDAGDVGSGHTVTAIYEVVPTGAPRVNPDLRYGKPHAAQPGASDELGFLSMRYKLPGEQASRLTTVPVGMAGPETFDAAPQEARFGVSVAGFAELLRGGRYTGKLTFDDVIRDASKAKGEDAFGYRSEFVQMVRSAKTAAALQNGGR